MKVRYKTISQTTPLRKIACFLFVFAILSNILYIPCYFYTRSLNRTNIIGHYQQKLDSGMQILDSSIESMLAFDIFISENNAYREIYYSNSDINASMLDEIRQVMRTYTTLPYNFISNFGLIQNENLLFTRNQVFFSREYLSSDYYFNCDDESYFGRFSDKYCFLPSTHFSSVPLGEYDAVTMGCRCSAGKNIYFFIHYPTQELISLFADGEVIDYGNISIYFGDTLLVSRGNLSENNFELLTVSSSAYPAFHIELQLSDSFIDMNLTSFKHLVQIFGVTILFMMCLWVTIFSLKIANPFIQISKALHETGYYHTEPTARNSIDVLVDGIKKMGVKLSDYDQTIQKQKENNRIHILEKALYRGLYDEASRRSFTEAFPDFPSHWQLVLIQYTSNDNFAELDSIQLLLTQYFHQTYPNIILLSYGQDSLLMLLPLREGSSTTAQLENTRNDIQEQYPVSISFMISQIYNHYSLLPDALQELEYSSFTLSQSPSAAHRMDLPISIQQLQTIYLSLSNGDEQAAVSTLMNSFLGSPDHYHLDWIMARQSYKMITYMLIQIKLENNILDVSIPNFKKDTMTRLFEAELPQCFAQITARLNEQHASQMRDLDQNIFAFIKENIGNQQLCISMVTDHFHISAPTLQKRIHSCVRKTFSSYVEDLRMEKAHQMLQDTSLTIQEISKAVGYTNANSFYKAYKRRYGEAPRSTRQNMEP